MVEIASSRYRRKLVETFIIVILYTFHEIRSKLEMLFYCYLVKGLGKIVAKISIFEISKRKTNLTVGLFVRLSILWDPVNIGVVVGINFISSSFSFFFFRKKYYYYTYTIHINIHHCNCSDTNSIFEIAKENFYFLSFYYRE